MKFIEESKCKDEVCELLDYFNPQQNEEQKEDLDKQNSIDKDIDNGDDVVSDYVVEALEEWAEIMHN